MATIVTPNIPEAKVFSRCAIRTVQDMEKAAKKIHQMGAKTVVIKGGHLRGQAVDVLFDGKEFFRFSSPRINTIHTHGTGCTLPLQLRLSSRKIRIFGWRFKRLKILSQPR